MSSKRCGSERGEVDFVSYFMRFGDRGGRRGRTDGRTDGGRHNKELWAQSCFATYENLFQTTQALYSTDAQPLPCLFAPFLLEVAALETATMFQPDLGPLNKLWPRASPLIRYTQSGE